MTITHFKNNTLPIYPARQFVAQPALRRRREASREDQHLPVFPTKPVQEDKVAIAYTPPEWHQVECIPKASKEFGRHTG